jgi:hypothetical protein
MPGEQTVPPDMIVPSMYGPPDPENPGRDVVHEPSYAAFLSIVTPIRDFQKAFMQATDGYLAAGRVRHGRRHAAGGRGRRSNRRAQ